jgi:hypothetical protein
MPLDPARHALFHGPSLAPGRTPFEAGLIPSPAPRARRRRRRGGRDDCCLCSRAAETRRASLAIAWDQKPSLKPLQRSDGVPLGNQDRGGEGHSPHEKGRFVGRLRPTGAGVAMSGRLTVAAAKSMAKIGKSDRSEKIATPSPITSNDGCKYAAELMRSVKEDSSFCVTNLLPTPCVKATQGGFRFGAGA